MHLNHEKQLTETENRALQRLTFEIQGYDVLIRSFTLADQEIPLDKEKWADLHSRRNKLIHLRGEILARLCGEGFTGKYEVDFSTGMLKWG